MSSWLWLQGEFNAGSLRKILRQTLIFFFVVNVLYVIAQPLNILDKVNVYNHLVPGRTRFSNYQKNAASLNPVSITRYDELFATHEISAAPKTPAEYRVIILGDSSIWGFGLGADDTLSACINRRDAHLSDGRRIRAFNLGYPRPNVFRDLIFLKRSLDAYHVEQVVWFVSGIGMYRPRLLDHVDVMHNATDVYNLLDQFPILVPKGVRLPDRQPSLLDRTLFAQRQDLSSWIKDQFYGFVWMQSRQDNVPFSMRYNPVKVDELGDIFDVVAEGQPYIHADQLREDDFLFDVLNIGQQIATKKGIPLSFRLQPMWSATPGTTMQRYNVYYPFWYIDRLKADLNAQSVANHWDYADWSNKLDKRFFTDSPFHFNPEGACYYADLTIQLIQARGDE